MQSYPELQINNVKTFAFFGNFFSRSLASLSLKNFSILACFVSEIFGLKKRLQQNGKVNHCNVTMEMSYNQKILVNMIEKVIYYVTFTKQSSIKTGFN